MRHLITAAALAAVLAACDGGSDSNDNNIDSGTRPETPADTTVLTSGGSEPRECADLVGAPAEELEGGCVETNGDNVTHRLGAVDECADGRTLYRAGDTWMAFRGETIRRVTEEQSNAASAAC